MNIKQSLFIALTLLFSVGAACAQAPTEKSLLWEVSGHGLTSPSYLYGTFHLLCPEELNFPESLTKKVSESKALYLELDFSDPSMMMEMQKNMAMKDGHSMKEYVSTEEYKRMGDSLQAFIGVPIDAVATIRPMLLASMLYPKLLNCNPGSPEVQLSETAKAHKVPVKGLETIKDQLQVFDDIPYKAQAEMLRDYLLEKDKMKSETEAMLSLYRTGDVAGMEKLMNDDKELTGKYKDALLLKRNRAWIAEIEKAAKAGTTFFAFGAGHLGGTEGVIALLRTAGYTVKPVQL